MKLIDKFAFVAYAFMPWIILWMLSLGGASSQEGTELFSSTWFILSPFVSLILVWMVWTTPRKS